MHAHLRLQLADALLQGVVGGLEAPAVGQARSLNHCHIVGGVLDQCQAILQVVDLQQSRARL